MYLLITSNVFQLCLRRSLREVGVESQRIFFNGKTSKMHRMSMSCQFCLQNFLPHTLLLIGIDKIVCFQLVRILNLLVWLQLWLPGRLTDGEDAVRFVHGEYQRGYHRSIFQIGKQYIAEVSRLCKENPAIKTRIDKPKVHHLLELEVDTVTSFSHPIFVSDMMFESHHQALKATLAITASSNVHIYATQVIVVRNFILRLLRPAEISKHGEDEKNKQGVSGVLNIFVCDMARNVDWTLKQSSDIKQEIETYDNYLLSDSTWTTHYEFSGTTSQGTPNGK